MGAACILGTLSARADLAIPSDGSDGVLDISSNTVVDLSLAVTGKWSDSNSGNSGKGIYDPEKWAVVFKYASVNVAAGALVTFTNHPSRAPVVWLVRGNAVLAGEVSLAGQFRRPTNDPDTSYLYPVEPGPGGFRGGASSVVGRGAGYGPGGGDSAYDSGAVHGLASPVRSSYGNLALLPLVGGSGAGGTAWTQLSYVGTVSGGAGAILIAAGGSVEINGRLSARTDIGGEYPGSGGAIKVIADRVTGAGIIDVSATSHPGNYNNVGRVRVEANSVSPTLRIFPNTIGVPPESTPVIWPPESAPTVAITSVNSVSAPVDPRAEILTSSDLNISTNAPVDILLKVQNFPPNGVIRVRVTPKYGSHFLVPAAFVTGDFASATWKATTPLPQGFCVLQAHATSP